MYEQERVNEADELAAAEPAICIEVGRRTQNHVLTNQQKSHQHAIKFIDGKQG